MKEDDPFWFCDIGGCEGASIDCINTCPYGERSGCPPLTTEPMATYVDQCRFCTNHDNCTKEELILRNYK